MVDLIAIIPFYLALALNHLEDIQIIGMFLERHFGYFFSMKKSYLICKLFFPQEVKKEVKINFSNFIPHLDFTLQLQSK